MDENPKAFVTSLVNQVLKMPSVIFSHTGIIKHTMSRYMQFRDYKARLQTFATWPKPDIIHPSELAESGFFYTGVIDKVTCFHCGGNLGLWVPFDKADREHKFHFHQCTFLLLKDKIHTSYSDKTCIVCLENKCYYALTPCGHMETCHTCILQCRRCPLCNTKIVGLLRIYL